VIRLVDEIFTLLSIGNSEASRSDWPNAGSVFSKPGFSLCGGKSLDAPQRVSCLEVGSTIGTQLSALELPRT
jgi:hypothetical protein